MIIKDRLIEVDIAEALAIAGKGEKVRCVGEDTGLMTIADVLEGLTFFAPESALAEKPELSGIDKAEKEIAKLGKAMLSAGPVSFNTPEERTRAIIKSVEQYDEEHGNPPVTKQEEPKKAEALTKEDPSPVPFSEAPSGGALKK